jgi:hypothetical protein
LIIDVPLKMKTTTKRVMPPRRSKRVGNGITEQVKRSTVAVDEHNNDADPNLATNDALFVPKRPLTLAEARASLLAMITAYITAGGHITPDQWGAHDEYIALVIKYDKRAASKKIEGEGHHVVPEHHIEDKKWSLKGFKVRVTKKEHIHLHQLLATFMPYNKLAKATAARMSGGANPEKLFGEQGGRASKGSPKTGDGAKGKPNTGGAAKGEPKTGPGAKGKPKTGRAAKGGVKKSKNTDKFNATCMECNKRVLASSTGDVSVRRQRRHRCLNSRVVANSAKRLKLDDSSSSSSSSGSSSSSLGKRGRQDIASEDDESESDEDEDDESESDEDEDDSSSGSSSSSLGKRGRQDIASESESESDEDEDDESESDEDEDDGTCCPSTAAEELTSLPVRRRYR